MGLFILGSIFGTLIVSPILQSLLVKLDFWLEDREDEKHGRHGDR